MSSEDTGPSSCAACGATADVALCPWNSGDGRNCGKTFCKYNLDCTSAHHEVHDELEEIEKRAKIASGAEKMAADAAAADADATRTGDSDVVKIGEDAEKNMTAEHVALCTTWQDLSQHLALADLAGLSKVAKFLRGRIMTKNKIVVDSLTVGKAPTVRGNRNNRGSEDDTKGLYFSISFLSSFHLPKLRKLSIVFNEFDQERVSNPHRWSADPPKPDPRFDGPTDVLCWLATHIQECSMLEEVDIEVHQAAFFMRTATYADTVADRERLQIGIHLLMKNLDSLPKLSSLRVTLHITDAHDTAICGIVESKKLRHLTIADDAENSWDGAISKKNACRRRLIKTILSASNFETLRLDAMDRFFTIMKKELAGSEKKAHKLRSFHLGELVGENWYGQDERTGPTGIRFSQILDHYEKSPELEDFSLSPGGLRSTDECESLQRFLRNKPSLKKVFVSLGGGRVCQHSGEGCFGQALVTLTREKTFAEFSVSGRASRDKRYHLSNHLGPFFMSGIEMNETTTHQLHEALISENIPHMIQPDNSFRAENQYVIELSPPDGRVRKHERRCAANEKDSRYLMFKG